MMMSVSSDQKNMKRKKSFDFDGTNEYCQNLLDPSVRKKHGIVFTPKWIVDKLTSGVVYRRDLRVIDPCCGSGIVILALIEKFCCVDGINIVDVCRNNVFGVDIIEENVRNTVENIKKYAMDIHGVNLVDDDLKNIRRGDSLLSNVCFDFGVEFDWVVSNPPYVKYQDIDKHMRSSLTSSYKTVRRGNFNMYFAFIELSIDLCNSGGRVAYITPNSFLTSDSGSLLRRYLVETCDTIDVCDFKSVRVFNDVGAYTCIVNLKRGKNATVLYRVIDGDPKECVSPLSDSWCNTYTCFARHTKLGEIVRVSTGIATLSDKTYLCDTVDGSVVTKDGTVVELGSTLPIIKGSSDKNTLRIIFPYDNDGVIVSEKTWGENYPACMKYLEGKRTLLSGRSKGCHTSGEFFEFGRRQNMCPPKGRWIYTPIHANRCLFRLVEHGTLLCNGTGIYAPCGSSSSHPLSRTENFDVLVQILNSEHVGEFIKSTSSTISGGYHTFNKNSLKDVPIPYITEEDICMVRSGQVSVGSLYKQK